MAGRHDYIPDAIEKGAVALVVPKDIDLPKDIAVIRVINVKSMAFISAHIWLSGKEAHHNLTVPRVRHDGMYDKTI